MGVVRSVIVGARDEAVVAAGVFLFSVELGIGRVRVVGTGDVEAGGGTGDRGRFTVLPNPR